MRPLVCGCGVLLLAASVSAQTARPSAPGPAVPDTETALKRAAEALSAGRRAEAALLLRSAADRFQSVRALLQLARLQSDQKDAAGARESLDRARAIAPNSEEVLSAHAELSLATGRPLPAILDLEPLTRMCPTVPQYHYLLGVALSRIGDAEGAVEPLREAQRLEPDRPRTRLALGRALNDRTLHAEARPHLLRALELEPDNVEAVASLAESQEGLGELQEAEAGALRALARSGTNATANLVMGRLRMKQERYEEARQALEKAMASEPASAKTHYALSQAYARLNDEASSRKHLELHRRKVKEMEDRVDQMRTQVGLAPRAKPR